MRRIALLFVIISYGVLCTRSIAATNLIEFFEDALNNDSIYQQALERTLAEEKNISINRAVLLPQVALQSIGQGNRIKSSGSSVNTGLYPAQTTLQSFDTTFTLTQTIINFPELADLANARLSAKQAYAQLNAAFQDLILRVAQAYLKVLYDKEYLFECQLNTTAFREQFLQARKLYKAGSINVADVYAAKAAYGAAKSRYISAKELYATDQDFLGTIAGHDITSIMQLSDNFPISLPNPQEREAWVEKAKEQNWSVKASSLYVQMVRTMIQKNSSGHLPTLDFQAYYEVNPNSSSQGSILFPAGYSLFQNTTVALKFNLPIYSGGLVVSKTKQAQHNYLRAQHQFEEIFRKVIHSTRKNYLNIMSNIEKINADKLTIQSAKSSLKGAQEHYRLGSGTMVDVLNQQEKILQAKTQYTMSKYEYIMSLLALKHTAGILCVNDLKVINSWLRINNPENPR